MVATLVSLRYRLLINGLIGKPWQLVGAILGALYGLSVLGLALIGLTALGLVDRPLASTIVVLVGSAAVLGWAILPVATGGIDQTVEPSRLAPFPLNRRDLIVALAVTAVTGIPGAVTVILGAATALAWWSAPQYMLPAALFGIIGAVTAVLSSRFFVAALSRVTGGRRSQELRGVVMLVLIIAIWPVLAFVGSALSDQRATFETIAAVVAWTPLGAPWAVAGDLAAGNWAAAAAHAGISIVTLVALVLGWYVMLSRSLERSGAAASGSPARVSKGLGLMGRFADSPTGAVAARTSIYWIRDPRYAQSLLVVPLLPALFAFSAGFSGNWTLLVLSGPIVAILLGLSAATDIAYDNTAFALHLSTGVSGRADRTGRVITLALFSVPLTLIIAVATTWGTDNLALLPGILGISLALLGAGFGIGSISSTLLVVPVPAPGDNPFSAKQSGSMVTTLVILATMAIAAVLSIAPIVLAVIGIVTGAAWAGWASLATGVVISVAATWIGIEVGARIYEQRAPQLLAVMRAR